jgi:hypothetical protein
VHRAGKRKWLFIGGSCLLCGIARSRSASTSFTASASTPPSSATPPPPASLQPLSASRQTRARGGWQLKKLSKVMVGPQALPGKMTAGREGAEEKGQRSNKRLNKIIPKQLSLLPYLPPLKEDEQGHACAHTQASEFESMRERGPHTRRKERAVCVRAKMDTPAGLSHWFDCSSVNSNETHPALMYSPHIRLACSRSYLQSRYAFMHCAKHTGLMPCIMFCSMLVGKQSQLSCAQLHGCSPPHALTQFSSTSLCFPFAFGNICLRQPLPFHSLGCHMY